MTASRGKGFYLSLSHLFWLILAQQLLFRGLDSWFPTQSPPKVEIASVIIEQLEKVKELTTVIFNSNALIPVEAERTWGNLVIGKTELLYLAHGEIRAGIDLTQLQPKDVSLQGQEIEINLPPPKILDSKIDVQRSQVYNYHRGFLNLGPDIAPELQTLAQRQGLEKILTLACEQGILDQVNQEAKVALTEFLQQAGHQKVTIHTETPNFQTCKSLQ